VATEKKENSLTADFPLGFSNSGDLFPSLSLQKTQGTSSEERVLSSGM
jgi:hypothetical protein